MITYLPMLTDAAVQTARQTAVQSFKLLRHLEW